MTENNEHISKSESAIYANLLDALSILSPLDTPGEPNTLIALCEKAMRIINESIRIHANSPQARHDLVSILADAGFKVWVETDEVYDTLGIRRTEIYVCFEKKP